MMMTTNDWSFPAQSRLNYLTIANCRTIETDWGEWIGNAPEAPMNS